MKFTIYNFQFSKGQSMFEVIVALFIIAMIIVGVVSLSTLSLSNSIFSRNKTLSGRYSQEATEWLRNEREKDSSLFQTNVSNSSVYCLQSLNWSNIGACNDTEVITGTIFIRQVNFTVSQIGSSCPPDCKNIITAEVKTYWNDSKGYHEAKSITDFSDIREK